MSRPAPHRRRRRDRAELVSDRRASPPRGRSVRGRRWPGSPSATRELNAFSRVLADEARAEAAERDRAAGRGRAARPAARRTDRDQGGDRRRRLRDDVRRRGQLDAGRRRRRGRPPAPRRRRGRSSARRRCRSSARSPTPSRSSRGITRNPWDPAAPPAAPAAVRRSRWPPGMVPVGIGGDGGGSIRIPVACCGLFGLKPQRGRVTTAPHAAPVVGARHRRAADPQRARQRDRLRRHPRQRRRRPLPRRRRPTSFVEAAGREPGRLRIGWSTKPVITGRPPRPGRTSRRSRTPRGCSPTSATTSARSTRTTPTRRSAFVPQFFAGIRTESDAVEHYDRLERRTRETYRLGTWVTSAGRSTGRCGRPRRSSAKANRVFDDVDVLLTPTIAHRPPRGRRPRRRRHRPRRRCASMPAIAYAALWNVAGNPAASVPVRDRRRRAAGRRPAGRPHRRRDHPAQAVRAARGRPAVAAAGTVSRRRRAARARAATAALPGRGRPRQPPRRCTPRTSSW